MSILATAKDRARSIVEPVHPSFFDLVAGVRGQWTKLSYDFFASIQRDHLD